MLCGEVVEVVGVDVMLWLLRLMRFLCLLRLSRMFGFNLVGGLLRMLRLALC